MIVHEQNRELVFRQRRGVAEVKSEAKFVIHPRSA